VSSTHLKSCISNCHLVLLKSASSMFTRCWTRNCDGILWKFSDYSLFGVFFCFIPLTSLLRFQFFCLDWGKVLFFCFSTSEVRYFLFSPFNPLLNVRCALSLLCDDLNNDLRYYKNLFKREDHSKWYLRNDFFCKRKSNNTNLKTCNL